MVNYMLTSLSELMQMAQLKMVANLKFYYRRNVYSEISISHLNCCTLSIDTLCCHVPFFPNRFNFSFREDIFKCKHIYFFFSLLDNSFNAQSAITWFSWVQVLHPRKKANSPFSFAWISLPAFENLHLISAFQNHS